jgi:thioredoxin reductase
VTAEVAIIGAGPYGLSLAAHLDARGVSFRIFGVPMEFWKTSMPAGMSLKSDGCASSIFDPTASFTLEEFCSIEGVPYADLGLPVTLQTFISYGIAFQQRMVPAIEPIRVLSVGERESGFTVTLDNGETFAPRAVVVAVGVGYFAYTPEVIAQLAPTFATHSSDHSDLSSFTSRDIAVVGAGSSALDLAALLHRAGARPVVIARSSNVHFHDRQRLPRTFIDRLRAPSSGIGPGWRSRFFCSAPFIFHFLPERWRLLQTKRHAGPSGGWFIKEEVTNNVPIRLSSAVESANVEGNRVLLKVSRDGSASDLTVDHVIAATGYRVDVDRLTFLDEALRNHIEVVQKTPVLSGNFESSVSGLYFVGPAAANSFGPLQRFAVGAGFAARRVARRLSRINQSQ